MLYTSKIGAGIYRTDELAMEAYSTGHDGVIIKNVYDNGSDLHDGKSTVYIVFNPRQIKSVYNRGTWDPESDDIRASVSTRD